MKTILLLSAALFLAACGAKLDGTYADPNGMVSYTFRSGGKVSMTSFGTEVEFKYEIEDDKVKILTPGATLVMTLLKDGSLQGPMGMKLVKKKT